MEKLIEACFLQTEPHPGRWPAERIFLLGFSQGGISAVDLVTFGTIKANSERKTLGGAISISGLPSEALYAGNILQVNRGAKILITHGSADEVVSNAEWKKRVCFSPNSFLDNSGNVTSAPGVLPQKNTAE